MGPPSISQGGKMSESVHSINYRMPIFHYKFKCPICSTKAETSEKAAGCCQEEDPTWWLNPVSAICTSCDGTGQGLAGANCDACNGTGGGC